MYNANKQEQDILSFWEKDNTFEKSVASRSTDAPYVFYDGPPFATGLPHYGHIVASTMKDAVPRFWTMKGKRVERIWGWDCHGLPIENIVEKELGTKSKQDIEEKGVAVFNELCRSKVLSYVDDWKKTITRLGRWVDMDNAYRTMDVSYMESVWWVFSELWNKGYVYKGYRPIHICPRCETTLSQQEVSEGYKDIKDLSVIVKCKVQDAEQKISVDGDVYMLAWTTTPWTLPGNILLAVGNDIEYAVVSYDGAHYIVAQDLVMTVFEGKEWSVVDTLFGRDLVGLRYEPLFPYFTNVDGAEHGFRVVAADFVSASDGTGVVHIAPAFGTDDYEVFKQEKVPFLQHVLMNGRFVDAVVDFAGMHVKPIEDHTATDVKIIQWLAHNGKLFSKKKYEHSYPHCWRCDTPLLNYAADSWFVNVTKIKERALTLAQKIDWFPAHMKEGRFGKWLEGAKDWSISRQRFWATPIPVWVSDDGEMHCIASVQELESLSQTRITDLHSHSIDHITFKKNGKVFRRVPDVLDTWFDSGSMPYAEVHYPFEHKEQFEKSFPAQFIAEGQDQTRAWFYYLHILGTALFDSPVFQHVIVNGIVLAEDGKKMSKKLQNYPDPTKVIEQYGADALRYYLLSSPVVQAESLSFSEAGVKEVYGKLLNTLYNVLEFYDLFAKETDMVLSDDMAHQSAHVLDQWILATFRVLVKDVTDAMERYALADATRPIQTFVTELSQWYVRRSRDRFKGDDKDDMHAALATLRFVLRELSKVMAPFTPFIAEVVYQRMMADAQEKTSVHLALWPTVLVESYDAEILSSMHHVRMIVELGLSLRKAAGLKVRQPLGQLIMNNEQLTEQHKEIIADELNVKNVDVQKMISLTDGFVMKQEGDVVVALDTRLTDVLVAEGYVRELIRAMNQARKEQGLTRDHRIRVVYTTADAMVETLIHTYQTEICVSVLASSLEVGTTDHMIQLSLDGHEMSFGLITV